MNKSERKLDFNNIDEFKQYIYENNINFADLIISQSVEDSEGIKEEVIPQSVEVQLIALHDNPIIKAKVSENNILYVDELNINEDLCIPAVINILGRKVSINLCNQDGKTHANLSIALDNKPQYNVVFEVRKLNGESFAMEVAKEMIEKNPNDT